MAERIGLIPTKVRLVKKNDELVDRIMKARGLDEAERPKVVDMLNYNIWTTGQFRDLTGKDESTINNKTRPLYKDGNLITELDFCYPHADLKKQGPKFIIRNEKSELFLNNTI